VLALLFASGCGSDPTPLPDLSPGELALRHKLGIPVDAQHVVIFGQSSHLDIDWQHTFDDYYSLYVGDVFLQARDLLDKQPRAFYGVAEMAFLQHHLEVHPEEVDALRAASQRGALRIVGGGMTSPDTLLPETEMLARDFLYGIRFAEDTLDAHPTAAWLPDSFGHGAAAPDLLVAAGYTSVGFSRIDGAPGIVQQINMPDVGPTPGSTADQLRQLGSADFLWKGAGGATILAHFMPGTGLYCEGDNLDYAEPIEPPGSHIGAFRGKDHAFTDASIDRYITELLPYAATRTMFVPVGCDFASPKAELIDYLDGYNARRYPTTHVYAVAASFEDYAAFVDFHRDALPTIDHELSPYFMGFYASRAELKRATRAAARPWFVAETFATLLGDAGATLARDGAATLSLLTRTDHHDFVTGTSADPVVDAEQQPLLANTEALGMAQLGNVASAIAARMTPATGTTSRVLALNASSAAQTGVVELDLPISGGVVPVVHAVASGVEVPLELIATPAATDTIARFRAAPASIPAFGWQEIDFVPGARTPPAAAVTLQLLDAGGAPAIGPAIARVVLANASVRAEWNRTAGVFALTSLVIDGGETIAAPSMTVHDYHDDGGLWRLGHEMVGCAFTEFAPPADTEVVQVVEQGNLGARVVFVGASATREAALGATAHALDLAIVTGAAHATTRTVSLSFAATGPLSTSVPGGVAVRPAQYVYAPTYWAAVSWARVGDVAVLLRQSTGVRMDTPGALELMAVRDARQESCDNEGGTGSDTLSHRIEWRIVRATSAGAAEREAQAFDRPLQLLAVPLAATGNAIASAGTLLSIEAGDGMVSALKPADRGAGIIVRVVGPGQTSVRVSPAVASNPQATRVDLVERDLGPAALAAGVIVFDATRDGSIASVRLSP
jgi:hypothetical protein